MQIPLDHPFRYYVEYRTSEGFNALQPCSTCNPRISASSIDPQGVTIRGLWEAKRAGGSISQFDIDTFLVGLRPLRAGQSMRDNYRKLNVNALEENDQGAKVQVVWD